MTDYLLIQALNGLVIGVIYAVIAAGLTVIFSILKIVNFAHGEVYMMGGYFGYFAISLAGIPPLPAVLVAMALSFVLSVLVERTLLTPLYRPPAVLLARRICGRRPDHDLGPRVRRRRGRRDADRARLVHESHRVGRGAERRQPVA